MASPLFGGRMIFNIAQSELARAVQLAARAVPKGQAMPYLACILIEAREDGVTFSATDMDRSVKVKCMALVEGEGAALVPAEKLAKLAKTMPDAAVSVKHDGQSIAFSCGKVRLTLPTLDPDDFPGFPMVDGDKSVLSAADFQTIAAKMPAMVSNDESRAVLCMVRIECKDGTCTAAATDGYKMGTVEVDCVGDMEGEFPASVIHDMVADSDVTLTAGDMAVSVRCGDVEMTARGASGTYPRWEQLFQRSNGAGVAAEFPGNAMVRALKRAQAMSNVVKVEASGNEIRLRAGGDDGEIVDSIDCDVFSDFGFTVDSRFMVPAIECIDAPMVQMLDSGNPVFMRGGRSRSLVMAMRG